MTSIIKCEAISGAMDDGPLCYLLQVDEFYFLLDCGWDERFDLSYMEVLKRRVPQIDAVLLSYADVAHAGALPYLVGRCGLSCPVYATIPVYKMGQMFMYDWYLSHHNVEEFSLFTLDHIDSAFDKVQQLKYNQQVSLKGSGHGLQITPVPAGHMIGGTMWRITKMGEEEIVYAVDFNHKKERHLNGCSFEGISRPNLLITDANTADVQQQRRKQRDEQLVKNILSTLRGGGDVLIVIDTAGRVLELANLLDQLWHNAEAGLITYNLVMMSNTAYNVVEFAKSQLEWMCDKISRAFEENNTNPFQFRHLQLCHSVAELGRIRSPKVVLASQPDMECGFSREIFLEWCADVKNSVILTSRAHVRSLASKLIRMATGGPDVSRHLTLEIKRRIRLEGAELEAYYQRKKEEQHEAARIRLETQRRSTRVETAESSDDSDVEELDTATHGAASAHPYDIMYKFEMQQRSSFFKQSKRVFPTYPVVEHKAKWDDYGEIIRPEDYMLPDSLLGGQQHAIELKRAVDQLEAEDTAAGSSSEVPSKCIQSITRLEVLCQLAYIDFEGVSDGESVRRLIGQVRPKQLVVVHGSAHATNQLVKYCKQNGIAAGRVFAPSVGDVVDATIESHIYQVTLTDQLMSQLTFQRVKDAELSWLDAKLVERQSNNSAEQLTAARGSLAEPMDSTEGDGSDGQSESGSGPTAAAAGSTKRQLCLDVLPANAIPSHQAVFVNDPKLSDLKQLLRQHGYQPEFSAGILYVNNVCSVKKTEAGCFQVEGTVCELYYKIRQLIYEQYAIV